MPCGKAGGVFCQTNKRRRAYPLRLSRPPAAAGQFSQCSDIFSLVSRSVDNGVFGPQIDFCALV